MFNQDLAWQEVEKYLNLDIFGKKIVCPYFTNHIGLTFMEAMRDGGLDLDTARKVIKNFNERNYNLGWWRGKGSPEQIADATIKIAEREKLDLSKGSVEIIREFMLEHGLGVDCSGFVYNVLSFAGVKIEKEVFKASAHTFGDGVSQIIDFKQAKSGDIILIKNKEFKYTHIALILEKNGLKIVQSTAMKHPVGIFVNELDIAQEVPKFGFETELGTDWELLWQEQRLEFRRLSN
jgi:hypothetical protein